MHSMLRLLGALCGMWCSYQVKGLHALVRKRGTPPLSPSPPPTLPSVMVPYFC